MASLRKRLRVRHRSCAGTVRSARLATAPPLNIALPLAPCSFQLCLFCYHKIRDECNNLCPGCRTPYDSDVEAGLRRGQERLEREAAEAAATAAGAPGGRRVPHAQPMPQQQQQGQQQQQAARAKTVLLAKRGGSSSVAATSAPLPPPAEPGRDLQIQEEQAWPSLGAGAATGLPPGQGRRPLPRVATRRRSEAAAAESSSSTSSGNTTATTPQSPCDSVVQYHARLPPSADPVVPAPAALHGHCHVALQAGGLDSAVDPEGASLCASLQEAVRLGTIGVKQAAATLASYLRRKQAAAWLEGPGAAAAAAAPLAPGSLEPSASPATSNSALLGGSWAPPALPGGSLLVGGATGGTTGSPARCTGRRPLYQRSSPPPGFPGFPSAAPASPHRGEAVARAPPLDALAKLRMPPPGFASLPGFRATSA